jgi:hypothetical protein
MQADVTARLASLGYAVTEADEWIINFAIEKVTWTIRNECNLTEIPDGLHYIAVDMVCGEVLYSKKGSGQLDELDVDAAVKSIKEGDTQVTYAIADNGVTLDGLIMTLREAGRSEFVTYRRLVW